MGCTLAWGCSSLHLPLLDNLVGQGGVVIEALQYPFPALSIFPPLHGSRPWHPLAHILSTSRAHPEGLPCPYVWVALRFPVIACQHAIRGKSVLLS